MSRPDDTAGGTHRDHDSTAASREDVSAAHLFLLLEGDAPTNGGAKLSLANLDEVRIGRGRTRAISVDKVDGAERATISINAQSLSSEHLHLARHGADWFAYDLRSTNGTRVNGVRVEQAKLSDGDLLEAGRVLLRFRAALVPHGARAVGFADGLEGGPASLLPDLERAYEALERIARARLSVIIGGETGSGKEVLARAVHSFSGRPGPFVAINCAAIPSTLLEATLFGHVRGAFSGAISTEIGLVRAADRGTLLLDEVGELSPAAQSALLRVLQEREVLPVGATQPVKVDVRILAATHRSLREGVEAGSFRADLFARLNGYSWEAPPLRERIEDFGVLTRDLLRRVASEHDELRVTAEAARALVGYDWPLNIRELEQVLSRAVALADGKEIDARHLPEEIPKGEPAPSSSVEAGGSTEESLRRHLIAHRGNVTLVARAMNKAPTQIYRWLKRFQIDARSFRGE